MRTHKAVTWRVEAKKLLSHRRQSEYRLGCFVIIWVYLSESKYWIENWNSDFCWKSLKYLTWYLYLVPGWGGLKKMPTVFLIAKLLLMDIKRKGKHECKWRHIRIQSLIYDRKQLFSLFNSIFEWYQMIKELGNAFPHLKWDSTTLKTLGDQTNLPSPTNMYQYPQH